MNSFPVDKPNQMDSGKLAALFIGVLIGLTSFFMLFKAVVESDWTYFLLWAATTFASALIIRWKTGFPAFSIYSLLYTLPVTVASVSMVFYLIDPPPAGPAGGNAINAGMQMVFIACCFASKNETDGGTLSWQDCICPCWHRHWLPSTHT